MFVNHLRRILLFFYVEELMMHIMHFSCISLVIKMHWKFCRNETLKKKMIEPGL